MNILIVSQNFYPEFFKSNDLASELYNKGNIVDVLTGIPNYPEGRYYKGYGLFRRRVDQYKGATVYRVAQVSRGTKGSLIRLSLNYLSFCFLSTLWILCYFVFKKRYDAIIIHQTSPITQACPGIILGKLRRIPVFTWVLDIWPDSVLSTLNSEKRAIKKPLDALTDWVYRNSKKILISSPGFKDLVSRNHDYSEKIVYFPNWSEDVSKQSNQEVYKLPSGFNIMLAGNIADGQGIEHVVKAIKFLMDYKDIHWVFLGGGAKLDWLKNSIVENNLVSAVTILGKQPFEHMKSYFDQATVMLITLKKSICPHLNATIPARIQSYLSASKPIVGMAGEGVKQMIESNQCGLIANSDDYIQLANNILDLYHNPNLIADMGQNSRRLYLSLFTMEKCITNLENVINK